MEISLAIDADLSSVLALQKLAYQSEAALYPEHTIPPMVQTLASLREDFGRMSILKGVEGREIVGTVRAALVDDTCRIGRLAVHPAHRRRGIGTALMAAAEQAFPDVRRYELFTGERSQDNLRLYRSLGYRELRRDLVAPGLSEVFMEKLRATWAT